MAIRVTIFEDNRKFRESLGELIGGNAGFELADSFENAHDAEAKIIANPPDVVLMDIEMPGVSGIEALKTIKKRFLKLSVLMQTVFEDEDKVFDAVVNGASGYILKNTSPVRILEAIVETYQGGAPMSPVIAKKVMKLMQDRHSPVPEVDETIQLTHREKEVLTMMVEGLSYKMIASRCNISFETVRSHIKNIYTKLHVGTMTEAVVKAVKQKLV